MSGISFCSPVLEQPQVMGKGRGRDQRCFPAPLCHGAALGQPPNQLAKPQGWKRVCGSLVRWGSDAVSLNGKGTGKKSLQELQEVLLED